MRCVRAYISAIDADNKIFITVDILLKILLKVSKRDIIRVDVLSVLNLDSSACTTTIILNVNLGDLIELFEILSWGLGRQMTAGINWIFTLERFCSIRITAILLV